ncbi:MAG: cobalamin-binding protein [Deltaproteobacteria bacterium]|nr:cobalamin-binding protein [Deltaproteobacteria bacterium]
MRICTLLPSATETAFALGLGDSVVAVSHECDFPAAAREKPVVVRGSIDSDNSTSREIDDLVRQRLSGGEGLYSLDLELLRRINPDIIITQGLCDVCAVGYDDVMAAAGSLRPPAKVLSLSPGSLGEVLSDIARVGNATGTPERAEALVDTLRERVERVAGGVPRDRPRPKVACLEWLDPLYAAGHWVPEMVELAGGMDVLAAKHEPSARVSMETLSEAAPEVMVLMPCGFDESRTRKEWEPLKDLPEWQRIPAVANGRVFAVDGSRYFNRPGPRLVDGLEILARLIHPEQPSVASHDFLA